MADRIRRDIANVLVEPEFREREITGKGYTGVGGGKGAGVELLMMLSLDIFRPEKESDCGPFDCELRDRTLDSPIPTKS